MFVDPAISRAKFDREIANCRKLADAYRRRGIIILSAEYPDVTVMFTAIHAKPAAMVPFATIINFDNYDVEPPSVQFINPFSAQKLKRSEIGYDFPRLMPGQENQAVMQPLLQAFVDEKPFICIQGVREYHQSVAHSADSWFLYRSMGPGTLGFLLDVISKYGAEPIRGAAIAVNLSVSGFAIQSIPK